MKIPVPSRLWGTRKSPKKKPSLEPECLQDGPEPHIQSIAKKARDAEAAAKALSETNVADAAKRASGEPFKPEPLQPFVPTRSPGVAPYQSNRSSAPRVRVAETMFPGKAGKLD